MQLIAVQKSDILSLTKYNIRGNCVRIFVKHIYYNYKKSYQDSVSQLR